MGFKLGVHMENSAAFLVRVDRIRDEHPSSETFCTMEFDAIFQVCRTHQRPGCAFVDFDVTEPGKGTYFQGVAGGHFDRVVPEHTGNTWELLGYLGG